MESQRSEVKECFTRATTKHNSKQSNIHHTSSPELSFSLVFYSLCYRISGSTYSLLARQSQRFLKHSTCIQDNEKSNYVVWPSPSSKFFKCPAVQKVWPPLIYIIGYPLHIHWSLCYKIMKWIGSILFILCNSSHIYFHHTQNNVESLK